MYKYQVGHEHSLGTALVEGFAHFVKHGINKGIVLDLDQIDVVNIALDCVGDVEAAGGRLGAYPSYSAGTVAVELVFAWAVSTEALQNTVRRSVGVVHTVRINLDRCIQCTTRLQKNLGILR